ncbi:MAG: hypothetical protein AAGE80_09420 [Pseudomonadota bacterium]
MNRLTLKRYANQFVKVCIWMIPVWLIGQFVWPLYQIHQIDSGGEASRGSPPSYTPSEIYHQERGRPANVKDLDRSTKLAMYSYPDLSSCMSDETIPGLEDARLLRSMGSDAEVEVCLFRLFASDANAEFAEAWLKANGLQVFRRDDERPKVIISGIWRPEEDGAHPLFPASDDWIPPMHTAIYAYWSDNGQILQSVALGKSYK